MPGIKVSPLPSTATFAASEVPDFGAVVHGFDPANASPEQYNEIEDLLYKHSILVFPGVAVKPETQYKLTKHFDPSAETYGHGNNKTGGEKKSILHPDLKALPNQPQVQLIGNGVPTDQRICQGLDRPKLKHPHHATFHKSVVSEEDEEKGITRFYRWHIDAALYDLNPPKVTTLYALSVPQGPAQVCRYDDGTGDELPVPLGTTAFVSGINMFEILPEELKSLAVRTGVRYAPHPYVWMAPAKAVSTGLGIENDGLELDKEELPMWEESKIKTFPMLWKNPKTGKLHLQVHPCGAEQLVIAPLPADFKGDRSKALYPDGGHITDLKQVRDLLYKMQRPAIAPKYVYAHDWREGDLCLFHNRGVTHTVVGAFKEDQVRSFWQCNLASGDEPVGPSAEDIAKYA